MQGRLRWKGKYFYKSGVIIGGKQNASARISRPRQLHDLEIDLEKRKADLSQIDDEILSIEANRKTLETKTQSLSHTSDEVQAQLRQVNSRLQQANLQAEKAKRQLDWNHTQQIQLETEELQIEKEINAAREKIKAGQAELSSVTEELQKTHSDSNFEEIDNLRSEYNYHLTSQAVNQRALNDLQKRIQEKREFIKNNEQNTTRHLDRTKQISENLKVLELNRAEKKSQEEEKTLALHDLQKSIDPAELELERLEANFNQMQELESSHQVALTNAEKHLTQAQMDLNHKRDNLEVLRRRVEEDFGLVAFEYSENQSGPTPLPIEGMVEELPRVEQLSPELEDSLSRQKAMLRRMGSVNPEAQAEYQTTKERYDFLKNQVADLFKAEEDLKKILQDLDALMKSEFLKTFEKVAAEFPKMFNRLFGGGGARLSLTDPENIHETGIDIHARLPGKREQELTLLSGGERSLTAVALIFALLKISPTPFCVLDEVDAALDETNVGRFRDLLVELSEEIQFILVTHNRNTVQAANVIYGITMGRDSTSQAISLRLDEVSEDMLGRA